MVTQETVRMMPGYRPEATKQVPAMSATLFVVVMRMMNPMLEHAMQAKRTGPFVLRLSERKHTVRSVTVAKA